MSVAVLTNTGQISIPKDILTFLGINTGDQIDLVIEKNRVVLQPVTVDVRDLKGILTRPNQKVVSIEEMNAAIARGAIGEVE